METNKLDVSVPFLVTKYLKQLKRGFFGGAHNFRDYSPLVAEKT